MYQFYFLSIVANLIAGLALSADALAKRIPSLAAVQGAFANRGPRTAAGAAALIVGFFKLFVRSVATDVPVAGDLLPALAGITLGGALVIEGLQARIEQGEAGETVGRVAKLVSAYRLPLGVAGLAIAILHFLIPGAVIF